MNSKFHEGNRRRLADMLAPGTIAVIYSGEEIRKTNDEYYPFFADRSFVYLTGISEKGCALVLLKDENSVSERLYILPPDKMAERWTGRRLTPGEAAEISGIEDIRYVSALEAELHRLLTGGGYEKIALDLYRASPADMDRPAHGMLRRVQKEYPYLHVVNANALIRKLRLIKQPCEIQAARRAEQITGEGILAMMKAARPGMYEYQLKAEFDRAIHQHGPVMHGFPPIVSAGGNNFCIHYYDYSGMAQDGDMVLNDVGAQWDNIIVDVSRGWPVNGRFSEKQRLLYECALKTSDYMFSVIRPGMLMADVDGTIRSYNAQLLVEAGVMKSVDEVSTYMWHGGAHHIGYDVHDVVETPEIIAPGMMFCVDVGIYHEAWGVGFRLEDNCLVTETGCENLSAAIPRTIEDIEDVMRHG